MSQKNVPNEIVIDGVVFQPKAQAPTGTRKVVIIDRGWIFAGNATHNEKGDLKLIDAVHVLRWESIGFDGVLANPTSNKVTLKPMPYAVEIPAGSVIFSVPVSDTWGLKNV